MAVRGFRNLLPVRLTPTKAVQTLVVGGEASAVAYSMLCGGKGPGISIR